MFDVKVENGFVTISFESNKETDSKYWQDIWDQIKKNVTLEIKDDYLSFSADQSEIVAKLLVDIGKTESKSIGLAQQILDCNPRAEESPKTIEDTPKNNQTLGSSMGLTFAENLGLCLHGLVQKNQSLEAENKELKSNYEAACDQIKELKGNYEMACDQIKEKLVFYNSLVQKNQELEALATNLEKEKDK